MEYYSKTFGLVTNNDPTTENGGTFLCHAIIFSQMLKYPAFFTLFLENLFYTKMTNAKIEDGLYMRSSYHTTRTVSQDELTSFFVSSFLLNSFHRYAIWDYMIKHFGVYSFKGGDRKLPFQPAVYYPWARLADSKIAFLFLPFYLLAFLISIHKNKQATSSKLLYMDELYALNIKGGLVDKLLYKFFVWKMKKIYGEKYIKGLIDIYFSSELKEHPIRALADSL